MSDLYVTIAEILTSHFGVDRTMIRPDVTVKDLGIDSLGLVELAVILQESGLEIDTLIERIDENTTLGQIAEEPLKPAPDTATLYRQGPS